jgi:hypothetical protein
MSEVSNRRQQVATNGTDYVNPIRYKLEFSNKGELRVWDKEKSELVEVLDFKDFRFLFVDSKFFLSGKLKHKGGDWFFSSTYRKRTDKVKVYRKLQGAKSKLEIEETVENMKPIKNGVLQPTDWSLLGTSMIIYGYLSHPEISGVFSLSLTATGRGAWFDYKKKLKRGAILDFCIEGIETIMEDGSSTKVQSIAPVFGGIVANEEEEKSADAVLDAILAYTKNTNLDTAEETGEEVEIYTHDGYVAAKENASTPPLDDLPY